jgi:hypothetical protein
MPVIHTPDDAGPVDRSALPPGSLRVHLAAVERSALSRTAAVHVAPRRSVSLTGPTVVASDGRRLVVVCAHHDGVVRVRSGAWPELRDTGTIDALADDLAVPVALVWSNNEWHLFARGRHGGSVHVVATADLATWRVCPTLGADFPAFAVSGACAVNGSVLLAGRVFVDRLVFGWGLLSGGLDGFEPRQVPSTLASPLGVLGPVDDGHGSQLLVLQVGTTCLVASSRGHGWTSEPLPPGLLPTALFTVNGRPWLAGYDPVAGRIRLSQLGSSHVLDLDDVDELADGSAGPSLVTAAAAHGDHVVLIRED